jgi:hypothetical protein
VANIVEWPLIMRWVKGVEVCSTPARSEQARDCGEHRGVVFGPEGSHELNVATIDRPAAFACSSSIPISPTSSIT